MVPFYHDQERKLLIYEAANSGLMLQHIPEARQINGRYVAVPQTLRNSQVLRWLGHPVAPIMTDYDWPIEPGRTPGEHQKLMANFMVTNPKCFNLSDPGTQKTLSALWAADWLMQQFPKGECRALIVGPLNVIETVWADALWSNFLGRRTFEICYGAADKRLKALARKADFSIVNIDGVGVGARTYATDKHLRTSFVLDGFSKALAEDPDIKLVIIDEADGYVDSQTKRHKIARSVYAHMPYMWMMTGTPTSQRPDEAYGLGKMLNNAHGKSYKQFRDETMIQVSMYVWKPKKEGVERAYQLLTPAIRFDLGEVWKNRPPLEGDDPLATAPPRRHKIALTEEQQKAVQTLKSSLQIELRSGKKITPANEAVARGKLLQIILGAVYDENHKAHVIDAEPRYAKIEEIIAQAERKVLIFCPLTSVVNLLYERLRKQWGVGVINGHVVPKARMAVISTYQKDPTNKVMIVDAQSVSHGINQFVVASDVIWVAPIDKTRLYIQGNRRVYRPGQTGAVVVHHITATALEEQMYARLKSNTSMQGLLLDMVKKGEL